MSSKKIIVVTGATGAQGSSVAKFLLDDGTFAVRAITRDPEKPSAKELANKGAEIITADYRDPAALKKAFSGAYGVFGITNFWEKDVGFEGEVTQGKNLVDAAKATGVKHFIWSTLDTTKHKPSHWESKAAVNEYLKDSGVGYTSLYTSFYLENYFNPGVLSFKKRDDGSYDYPLPLLTDAPFAVFSVAETGAFVLAAFLEPEKWLNKDMRIATDFISVRETASILKNVTGKKVHFEMIDKKTWDASKGETMSEEFHANYAAFFDDPKAPFRDPKLAREIYPAMKKVSDWVKENVEKIFPVPE